MERETVGVVGATGLVGRQVIAAWAQRTNSSTGLRLMAGTSAGEELDVGVDDGVMVEPVGPDAFRGLKAVILACPPQVAKDLAARAQSAGIWVVDVSGAMRASPEVPLVAPGVNEAVLDQDMKGRVVALASPAAQALLLSLEPLRAKYGLLFADVTVLHGAATLGTSGVERLARQTAELLNAKEPEADEAFPHRFAFNVVPEVGPIERGISAAERALLVECARVWPSKALPGLTCTALQVPTYHGLTLVISAHLGSNVDAEGVRQALKAEPALKLLDEPESHIYPMPMLTTDDAAVHVGRVRALGPRVQLVAAVDNAVRAADTAVELALELGARD